MTRRCPSEADFCADISSEMLQEVGLADMAKRVSRNRFLDFVSRYEDAYIAVSEAYLRILEGLEKIVTLGLLQIWQ